MCLSRNSEKCSRTCEGVVNNTSFLIYFLVHLSQQYSFKDKVFYRFIFKNYPIKEGLGAAGQDRDEAEGTRVQPNGTVSHDDKAIDHDS